MDSRDWFGFSKFIVFGETHCSFFSSFLPVGRQTVFFLQLMHKWSQIMKEIQINLISDIIQVFTRFLSCYISVIALYVNFIFPLKACVLKHREYNVLSSFYVLFESVCIKAQRVQCSFLLGSWRGLGGSAQPAEKNHSIRSYSLTLF